MSCSLCDMEQKTKWHVVDPRFIICDCLSCDLPMVVYRLHGKEPSEELKEEMLKIAKKIFGENIKFRGFTRNIPKEVHWHEHFV